MINKDKMKGFIAGASVAIILFSTTTFAEKISKTVTAVYNNIKIMIDGEEITPKDANGKIVEPFIIDGTTYLPVRAIASALGEDVNWDGETNTVYIGQMPVKKTEFSLDASTLEKYTQIPLYKVGNQNINGGMFNVLLNQAASDSFMKTYSDNYSPDKTLQTLTINSQPASKFFGQEILNELTTIFSVYDEAERTGFLKNADVISAINYEWESFLSQFASEEEYNAYLLKGAILPSDMQKLINAYTVYYMYADKVYSDKLFDSYDTSSFEAAYRKNYITAKHILVEDEALAKEIIKSLQKGADFDVLMKNFNIDPGATSEGYTFTYNEMVKPFEDAAFALKENTFTQNPVKTDYGYHIIYRCPLNEEIVKEAVNLSTESLASKATEEYLSSIAQKVSKSTNSNYEKYITSIK